MKFTAGGETISITCPDRDALLAEVRARLGEGRGFTLATLNVDHLEKLRHDAGFRAAYGAHDLVVADGNPIVWLSQIAGRPVKLVLRRGQMYGPVTHRAPPRRGGAPGASARRRTAG